MTTLWQDQVELKVYISTAGDFVALGNRQEYPFVAGGSGYPSGWTMYNSASTSPSDVNWTTQNGRFSVSNASTTDSHGGKFYGVYRDFPVTPGKFYIFQLQARRMDDKTGRVSRNIRHEWSNGAGSGAFGFASDDWEQVSIPTGAAPAGATFLRIIIQGVYYWGASNGPGYDLQPDVNWGVQFQNVSIIEQDATYPAPTWEEVTCEVRAMGLRYGRDKFVNRYDVASMTLTVRNDSGYFTYEPYGATLRPGRFIKVEVKEKAYANPPYSHFYGIIDSLADSFTLDGRVVTTIQAVDISSLLSGITVPTASWDSNVYKSGSRFRRLLDAVAWHPSMRSAMTGLFNQQPVLANGRSVRDELGLIADSEGGYFYADRAGVLTYMDRSWNSLNIRAVNAELMAQPVELVTPLEPTVKFAFNGVVGNYMQVPHHPNFNLSRDGLDIACRVEMLSSTGTHVFCARYGAIDASSWIFRMSGATRTLSLFLSDYGGSRQSTVPVPYANGVKFWARAIRNVTTGTTTFYTGSDTEQYADVIWTQLGAPVTGVAGALPAITQGITIGTQAPAATPATCNIWQVRVTDGVTTPVTVLLVWVVSAKDEGPGATSFGISTPSTTVTVAQVSPWQVIQLDPTPGIPQLPVVDDIPDVSSPSAMPIVCLQELQTTWSRDRVVNEVSLANQGGSAITTIDPESQKKYGPRTYQRMDFLNTNDDISYLTTRTDDIMEGYTDAILRVNSVKFRPTPDTNVYWFSLRVFLNWLVRVRYTHPTQGWGFSVVSHVQGVEHAWGLTDWEVTLYLDNPEAFNFWNDATSAGWDQSEWDIDLWDTARTDEVYWSSGQKWSEGHVWGA